MTDKFKKPGRYTYLPVLGFSGLHSVNNADVTKEEDDRNFEFIGDKRLTWWDNNSLLQPKHPYMLINPTGTGTQFSNEGTEVIDNIEHNTDDVFVSCDSGGFQVKEQEDARVVETAEETDWRYAQIHPETLARFEVLNANEGTILDMPPYPPGTSPRNMYGKKNYENWKNWIFGPYLGYTIQNARRMHDVWDDMGVDYNHDFDRMGVIQGQPGEGGDDLDRNLRKWHEGIESVGNYDAYSLKPDPSSSAGQVALHLGYAADNLQHTDRIHVLQVGGAVLQTLCSYYAWLTGQWVTSDSSNHTWGARYRRMYIRSPCSFTSSVTVTEREDAERKDAAMEASRFDMFPCQCCVCREVKRVHGIEYWTTDDSDTPRYKALTLHNLKSILERERTFQSLIRAEGNSVLNSLDTNQEEDELISYGGSRFWKTFGNSLRDSNVLEVYKAMKFINICYNKDFDTAANEYNIPWSPNSDNDTIKCQNGESAMEFEL